MIQLFLVFGDWGLLALRLALGIIMVANGWPKIRNLKATAVDFEKMGFKPPFFWGGVAACVEFFGGLALVFGFFTQIFAFLMVIQFLVAIFKVKRKQKLIGGFEFDLLIVASAFAVAALGAGSLSLDAFWRILLY